MSKLRAGLVALVPLLAPGVAQAFCGAYVGSAGAELYNQSSQIVLARAGQRTTLTLANDYEGDLSEFALVIPVPDVVLPQDVRVVSPDVFSTIDQYSSPRTVAYTCEDAISEDHWPSAAGCGLMLGCSDASLQMDAGGVAGTGEDAAGSVTIEAAFAVSEYDIVVLSATESGGLTAWLEANGYAMPAGGEDVLQSYIDAGSYFLAAKVSLEAVGEGAWLSPLQFSYTSDAFSLPLRIGTVSSRGVQDLLLYVLTGPTDGEVRIANYPEIDLDDECMWTGDDFGAFYEEKLRDATMGLDRAGWLVEYGWRQDPYVGLHCDPCTTPPPPPGATILDLTAMGWPALQAHFTRIHMRYRPDQIDEDIVLYASGVTDNTQQRYIDYVRELEFLFPVCGEGYVDEPGQCGDALDEEGQTAMVGCAVQAGPTASFFIGLVALVAMRRRR